VPPRHPSPPVFPHLGRGDAVPGWLLPFRETAISAVRVSFLAAGLDCGVVRRGGNVDPDQGSEAGDRRQTRQLRDRHRLGRGADRAADGPHQRAHGAPPRAPEGPLLAPRPAQARRPPPAAAAVPAEAEPRGLPRPHPGARPEEVGRTQRPQPKPEGGSLREPQSAAPEADSNLHSPRKWRKSMATTTEPRVASVSVTVGDQELTFESGKLAKQADGAGVVRAGGTMGRAPPPGRKGA